MPAPNSAQAPAPNTVCVGRQAILDRGLEVYGYELLYRGHAAANGADVVDGDMATSSTLLNSFMEIGIERLTGGHMAFVNLTRGFFVDMPSIPFDKESVVLELLEDIPVDDPLIDAVRRLHAEGYTLAVDDYLGEDKWAPLLPYVKIVKVEITAENLPRMGDLIEPLRGHGLTLLAERSRPSANSAPCTRSASTCSRAISSPARTWWKATTWRKTRAW